jgi:RNA-directed DNA polymerase
MQPTIEILARISVNSNANKDEVFTRLYRYLLRPDIYFEAYKNLYANNGAATRGVDNDTADGFSEAKIDKIIKSLSDETYTPKSVRRTYIDKGNGKKRPLGIPTFTDKLVQEALRMVLEAVYEPSFLDWSHGFRPNRSCHTALASLKKEFTGARWFVEGDIKGCFDNIDHAVLISMLNKKVLAEKLSVSTGKTVQLQQTVDPALIGGIKIRMQDQIIDATVAKRLEMLKEKLKQVKIS